MTREAFDAFSRSYAEAATRFRSACASLGASVERHHLSGLVGPAQEPLSVDVASLGDPGADSVLLVVSGVHGIEGFAGSACQLAFLEGMASREALPGRVVLVHALNPWGFAHEARTNEDNIDLNRNFVGAQRSLPKNELYPAIHAALLPVKASEAALSAGDRHLAALIARYGQRPVQAAITAGQQSHPDGLFYGGSGPAWSNLVFRDIVSRHAQGRRRVAMVDIHTGLGARGAAEVIFRARRDDRSLQRARAWFGEATTTSEDDTSSSTPIDGNAPLLLEQELVADELTAVTLEFGTQPALQVLTALRYEQLARSPSWRGEACVELARGLMREAFCPADADWRHGVVTQGLSVLRRAASGLFQHEVCGGYDAAE